MMYTFKLLFFTLLDIIKTFQISLYITFLYLLYGTGSLSEKKNQKPKWVFTYTHCSAFKRC